MGVGGVVSRFSLALTRASRWQIGLAVSSRPSSVLYSETPPKHPAATASWETSGLGWKAKDQHSGPCKDKVKSWSSFLMSTTRTQQSRVEDAMTSPVGFTSTLTTPKSKLLKVLTSLKPLDRL